MSKYICYTDGSYQESLSSGGWASIILDEQENVIIKLYQGMTHTTNNRMEIRAIIETLKYFQTRTNLEIISDSQYVVNSINSGAVFKWISENDLSKKNLDLWFELIELVNKHNVVFKWVKGHNGNKWNEEADKWCTFAAQCYNLPRDVWTIESK